jgi:hypothetical protein
VGRPSRHALGRGQARAPPLQQLCVPVRAKRLRRALPAALQARKAPRAADHSRGGGQDVVFSAAYSGALAPYSPAAFLYAWWRHAEHHLAGYQQQDAHEFYLYALAGLSYSRLPAPAAGRSDAAAPGAAAAAPAAAGAEPARPADAPAAAPCGGVAGAGQCPAGAATGDVGACAGAWPRAPAANGSCMGHAALHQQAPGPACMGPSPGPGQDSCSGAAPGPHAHAAQAAAGVVALAPGSSGVGAGSPASGRARGVLACADSDSGGVVCVLAREGTPGAPGGWPASARMARAWPLPGLLLGAPGGLPAMHLRLRPQCAQRPAWPLTAVGDHFSCVCWLDRLHILRCGPAASVRDSSEGIAVLKAQWSRRAAG